MGGRLVGTLVYQSMDLVSVCAEDVVFAAAEVGVDLAGQQSILRDVRLARVVVQWQQKQPDDADNDAQGGQVGRDLQDAGIAAEAKNGGSFGGGRGSAGGGAGG